MIRLVPTLLKLVEACHYVDWMKERVRAELSPWPSGPSNQTLADLGITP